jgi:hypothetical protein
MAGVGELSHESVLARAGSLGLSTALAELPALLQARGLDDQARRLPAAHTKDTLSALVAYVLPGDDAYSLAQGVSHPAAGGVEAGTVPLLAEALDHFAPNAAAGVSVLLNDYARQVDPDADRRRFPRTPFARLAHAHKSEVFRRFQADPGLAGTQLGFAAGILPGFVAFIAFSKAGVYAPGQRAVARRVGGWAG